MQKVSGYDDKESRNPEPMHNTSNEITTVTVMARGGTTAIYSVARLREVAEWEIALNNSGQPSRWEQKLRPYLTGIHIVYTMCTTQFRTVFLLYPMTLLSTECKHTYYK